MIKFGFAPKRTIASVAQELHDGLLDGSILFAAVGDDAASISRSRKQSERDGLTKNGPMCPAENPSLDEIHSADIAHGIGD